MSGLMESEDTILFLEEETGPVAANAEGWKVLLVDDEPQIHSVTTLALSDFTYDDRGLNFLSAYSGAEAKQVLAENPDVALIFLDVVMETDDAGLRFVEYVRNELGNKHVRIILRTGQPGLAPEREIMRKYDVDDYKAKTDMTVQKLVSSVVASLRGFKEIKRVEQIVDIRTSEAVQLNKVLSSINRDLTDSIVYARRIQEAILPIEDIIRAHLPRFAVYYQPKDVVSGDFYWFFNRGDELLFAAVDCTGHGVPGAFMSVLGLSMLNQASTGNADLRPNVILNKVDSLLRRALQRTFREGVGVADGMDVALCNFNIRTQVLQFAGARRPLLICRADGTQETLRGTPCSIGGPTVEEFELHEFQMQHDDVCFLYTDGIPDQFGGEYGRKLSPRRLKEFLKTVYKEESDVLRSKLTEFVAAWQGDFAQTDDMMLLAVRL
jgi:serine phosphatase RsbU (regulator of sigma subunit)